MFGHPDHAPFRRRKVTPLHNVVASHRQSWKRVYLLTNEEKTTVMPVPHCTAPLNELLSAIRPAESFSGTAIGPFDLTGLPAYNDNLGGSEDLQLQPGCHAFGKRRCCADEPQ